MAEVNALTGRYKRRLQKLIWLLWTFVCTVSRRDSTDIIFMPLCNGHCGFCTSMSLDLTSPLCVALNLDVDASVEIRFEKHFQPPPNVAWLRLAAITFQTKDTCKIDRDTLNLLNGIHHSWTMGKTTTHSDRAPRHPTPSWVTSNIYLSSVRGHRGLRSSLIPST